MNPFKILEKWKHRRAVKKAANYAESAVYHWNGNRLASFLNPLIVDPVEFKKTRLTHIHRNLADAFAYLKVTHEEVEAELLRREIDARDVMSRP